MQQQPAEEKKQAVELGVSVPLAPELRQRLHLLLFGPSPVPQDVQRWGEQGFYPCEDIRFGLKQLYGGPCGVLAAVQAYLLRQLLFVAPPAAAPSDAGPVPGSDDAVTEALVHALALMIERAHGGKGRVVVTGTSLEELQTTCLGDEESVRQFISKSLPCLRSGIGVLVFVFSVILSRGLEQVEQDMDDPQMGLVGRFGHCSQDLVNLMLAGKAVTNVFDGDKHLGGDANNSGLLMRGITERNEVGFLTLLEALRYSKVGDHYKCPHVPIWVVGSSSHYTVMFSKDARVGQMTEEDKLLSKAKSAFLELDPEENGFIKLDDLARLAHSLDIIDPPLDELKRLLDADGMGICLWASVKIFLKSLREQESAQWSCSVCTYLNSNNRTVCEMCQSPRGIQAVPVEQSPPQGAPRSFDLFHFNGIEGHGGARAGCNRVEINVLDEDIVSPPSQAQTLREVIRTRWPSALANFPDQNPKI